LLDGRKKYKEEVMQLRAAVLILLLSSSFINAQEWSVESLSYSMENDTDVDVDGGYTHGARLSVLFLREDFQDSWLKVPYLSFAIANQMYNPYDQDNPELIKDDRPYAGWSYVEVGLHQASLQDLDSLTLQLGIVGPASKMEELQNAFHGKIDAGNAMGWDNQLSNEVTLQVNYMHKWRYELENIYGLESVIVPYAGANLGNVSIKASGGALYSTCSSGGWGDRVRDFQTFLPGESREAPLFLVPPLVANSAFPPFILHPRLIARARQQVWHRQ